jgi:hypothetical protein
MQLLLRTQSISIVTRRQSPCRTEENAQRRDWRDSDGGGEKRAHAVTCPCPTLSLLLSARLPGRHLASLFSVCAHRPDIPIFLLNNHGGQGEDRGPPSLCCPSLRYRIPGIGHPSAVAVLGAQARPPDVHRAHRKVAFFLSTSPPPPSPPPPLPVALRIPPPYARSVCGTRQTTRLRAPDSSRRRAC